MARIRGAEGPSRALALMEIEEMPVWRFSPETFLER